MEFNDQRCCELHCEKFQCRDQEQFSRPSVVALHRQLYSRNRASCLYCIQSCVGGARHSGTRTKSNERIYPGPEPFLPDSPKLSSILQDTRWTRRVLLLYPRSIASYFVFRRDYTPVFNDGWKCTLSNRSMLILSGSFRVIFPRWTGPMARYQRIMGMYPTE